METILSAGEVAGAISAVLALLALVLWRPLKAARKRRMEYRKAIMEKLDRIIDDVADLQYERLSQAHDFYTTRGGARHQKRTSFAGCINRTRARGATI